MTNLKNEAIELIESVPDEQTDVLIKIIGSIREILLDDFQRQDEIFSRAEQDLALMEDVESLTREGGDVNGRQ